MAKKRSRQTVRRAPAQSTTPVEEQRFAGRQADLSVEYHYVLRDLRQIALIAAGLIAGLVILSFLI